MPLFFALLFFGFIALTETLRQGLFGMSASEVDSILRGALLLCALAILRGDVVHLLRPAREALYGEGRLRWTWGRTAAGLALGPVLLGIPLVYGALTGLGQVQPVDPEALLRAVLLQAGLVIGVDLFLREAAVKAFAGHGLAMVLASVLATIVLYMPRGIPLAMMAAGAGAFWLALRLAGVNILAVVLVHAVVVAGQNQVIPLSVEGADAWQYATWFTVVALGLAFTVAMIGPQRREGLYA